MENYITRESMELILDEIFDAVEKYPVVMRKEARKEVESILVDEGLATVMEE